MVLELMTYLEWAGSCICIRPLPGDLTSYCQGMSALRVYAINPETQLPAAATLVFALIPVALNIVS